MQRIWLVLVAVGLAVLCAQIAVQAVTTLRMRAGDVMPVRRAAAIVLPVFAVETQGEIAAPTKGVTGTTALPALPTFLSPVVAETGVFAARPFSLTMASVVDRGRAVQCLTAAIYYEAAAESDAGQRAVAQVVLNRVRHPAFPATVCGVVYQGSEHTGCQFSFACDGAILRVPERAAWARAARVAGMALAGYVYAPVGLATHYHTYAVTPAWNRTLVMTDVVGAHFFHRWKGYWGTAAAFGQRYIGREPVPGSHAVIAAVPVVAAVEDVPVPMTIPVPIRGAVPVQRVAPVEPNNLPAESQILDRWKDSGKPL